MSKNRSKVGSEIVNKVGSKTTSKNSVLAFPKYMDGSALVSLKSMDDFVMAHFRFSM